MPRLPLALALALTVASSGCYYTFGTAPPARPTAAATCTRSRALPIADTVIAAYGLAGLAFGAWALASIRDDGSLAAGEGQATATMLAVTGAGLLVGNGLSARAGFRDTARCRAAR